MESRILVKPIVVVAILLAGAIDVKARTSRSPAPFDGVMLSPPVRS
jgi:hypothetical protein